MFIDIISKKVHFPLSPFGHKAVIESVLHMPPPWLKQLLDIYFLKKANPEAPYMATKFSSTDEVKRYLYNMMNLDYTRYNEQMGAYAILQNNRLL